MKKGTLVFILWMFRLLVKNHNKLWLGRSLQGLTEFLSNIKPNKFIFRYIPDVDRKPTTYIKKVMNKWKREMNFFFFFST